jgi:hypothetical protein
MIPANDPVTVKSGDSPRGFGLLSSKQALQAACIGAIMSPT